MALQSFYQACKQMLGRSFAAIVLLSPWCARAVVLTVNNFDEDLATVYVNGAAATNGQQIAVEGQVTLELKDFRNDYYFRFAPEDQVDRNLALENWEGVPEGSETHNPVTFTAESDLTVTPNVDVKGYAWQAGGALSAVTNKLYVWNAGKFDTANRLVYFYKCKERLWEGDENCGVLDLVQRVRYDGKNYTVQKVATDSANEGAKLGTVSFPWRLDFINGRAFAGAGLLTNVVGAAEIRSVDIGSYSFFYNQSLAGEAQDIIPRGAKRIRSVAYNSSKIVGRLELDNIEQIDSSGLGSIAISEIVLKSPTTISIGSCALRQVQLRKVVIKSPLASFAADAIGDSVTNIVFETEPPPANILANVVAMCSKDKTGAYSTRITVDPGSANWWSVVSEPTAEELALSPPENCMGVYEDRYGFRKAWVVADGDLDGVLLVGDMTMVGYAGFVPKTGLQPGDTVELAAPAGMSRCELQHRENGVWTTFKTENSASFTYTHDGTLTRAVWRMDGFVLNISRDAGVYGGTVEFSLKSGECLYGDKIYAAGSVVEVRAIPVEEHPRTKLHKWTGDVPQGQEHATVLELTIDRNINLVGSFAAAEWAYDEKTKKITDGHWTSTAAATGDIVDNTLSYGNSDFTSSDYSAWLDFSLPVYIPTDPEGVYWIREVYLPRSCSYHRVRFGEHITSLRGSGFWQNTVLAEVEGLGKTRLSQMNTSGNFFFYNYGSYRPLRAMTYEATDIVPETLVKCGGIDFCDGPTLKGTLRLSAVTNLNNIAGTWYISGVTNVELLAEAMDEIHNTMFAKLALTQLTIGSTNLVKCATYAFQAPDGANNVHPLRELTFKAHAPAVAALDEILRYVPDGQTVIYCSRWAPGWKAMNLAGYRKEAMWKARPEDAWGIYRTADGKKSYYLVQRDSVYGPRPGLQIIIK